MDIDTALLRSLIVLDKEKHFGRSAERLGISQQSLSKQMAKLETLLDKSAR